MSPTTFVATLKDTAADGAGTHSDHELWLWHLFVGAQQAIARLQTDRASADQHIGMARATLQFDPESFHIITGC